MDSRVRSSKTFLCGFLASARCGLEHCAPRIVSGTLKLVIAVMMPTKFWQMLISLQKPSVSHLACRDIDVDLSVSHRSASSALCIPPGSVPGYWWPAPIPEVSIYTRATSSPTTTALLLHEKRIAMVHTCTIGNKPAWCLRISLNVDKKVTSPVFIWW